jgi:hypothetical protein
VNTFLSFRIVLCFLFFLFSNQSTLQASEGIMHGWGMESAYNKLFDPARRVKIKAIVLGVKEIVPMVGMSPGIALDISTSKGERVMAHLGPKWFCPISSIKMKTGETIKLYGVWARIGEERVFMAAKLKKENFYEIKFRLTKNGQPFWTMTPEQLAQEMPLGPAQE